MARMSQATIPVSWGTHREMGRIRHLPWPESSKKSTAKDGQTVTSPQGTEKLRGLGRQAAAERVGPCCRGHGPRKRHSTVPGAKPAFPSQGLLCCCK